MQKIIQKYGSSLVIRLTREDRKIYNLKEGMIINVPLEDLEKKDDRQTKR